GALFAAFVVWGTGLETAREQSRLQSSYDQLDTPLPDPDPVLTRAGGRHVDEPVLTPADELTVGQRLAADGVAASGSWVDRVIVEAGMPLVRLQVAAIDVDVIVVPGVTVDDLKMGPGHDP